MGLGDVVLFFVTAGTSVQWVAIAAAAGPSSLVVWLIGCATMAYPLAFCVIDLTSRYPDEGGLYVWSTRIFGDFAGFMTGWTYWASNLPYLSGVLYFAASNLLQAGGPAWQSLAGSPWYFITVSVLGLAIATVLNILGLSVGKWLTNAGAVSHWLETLLLIGLGLAAWIRFGCATTINATTLRPGLALKDLVFWSTIAFALTGLEAASFMGGEIHHPRRNIPRGILIAVPLLTLIYFLGTASVLVALPTGQVSGLQGIMQAVRSAAERVGVPGVAPLAALLMSWRRWFGGSAQLARSWQRRRRKQMRPRARPPASVSTSSSARSAKAAWGRVRCSRRSPAPRTRRRASGHSSCFARPKGRPCSASWTPSRGSPSSPWGSRPESHAPLALCRRGSFR